MYCCQTSLSLSLSPAIFLALYHHKRSSYRYMYHQRPSYRYMYHKRSSYRKSFFLTQVKHIFQTLCESLVRLKSLVTPSPLLVFFWIQMCDRTIVGVRCSQNAKLRNSLDKGATSFVSLAKAASAFATTKVSLLMMPPKFDHFCVAILRQGLGS